MVARTLGRCCAATVARGGLGGVVHGCRLRVCVTSGSLAPRPETCVAQRPSVRRCARGAAHATHARELRSSCARRCRRRAAPLSFCAGALAARRHGGAGRRHGRRSRGRRQFYHRERTRSRRSRVERARYRRNRRDALGGHVYAEERTLSLRARRRRARTHAR
jgi:hypothetical protein